MRRVLAPLLLALALLAPIASGGEPRQPPPIDPVEVGRLLLSKDDDERARGTRLLHARIQRGGDLKPFLAAMAKAQAEYADAEERLRKRFTEEALHGTPEEQERALRVLEALGEDAVRGYLDRRAQERRTTPAQPPPPSAAVEAPQAGAVVPKAPGDPKTRALPRPGAAAPTEDAQPAPDPEAPQRDDGLDTYEPEAPFIRLAWNVLEVPTSEIETWLREEKDPHGTSEALLPLRHGRTVVLGAQGRFALARAETLPEARSRLHVPEKTTVVGRVTELLPGTPVRYRCCVERAGKGAWGVKREELTRGLSVTARVEPRATGLQGGKPYELRLEVKHTDVPLPMRVETVRPASNVEPLEVDRPEWQTAVARAQSEINLGDDVFAFVPGVVPEKVVVVHVRLRHFGAPQAASRELER